MDKKAYYTHLKVKKEYQAKCELDTQLPCIDPVYWSCLQKVEKLIQLERKKSYHEYLMIMNKNWQQLRIWHLRHATKLLVHHIQIQKNNMAVIIPTHRYWTAHGKISHISGEKQLQYFWKNAGVLGLVLHILEIANYQNQWPHSKCTVTDRRASEKTKLYLLPPHKPVPVQLHLAAPGATCEERDCLQTLVSLQHFISMCCTANLIL
jgi:hypothetical protein